MPVPDQDQYAGLFEAMNDAAVGYGAWTDALADMQRLLDVRFASIDIVDKKSGTVRLLVTEPVPPDELALYNEHIWRVNPRYSLVPAAKVGEIVGDRHIDPELDAQAVEYYEWLRRAGGTRYFAGVKLYENDDYVALSSIHVPAERGPIDRATEALYAKLLPQLANALAVHQSLAERGNGHPLEADDAEPGRAYALLDREGRILECSKDFQAAVTRSGTLMLHSGRLGGTRPDDQARLGRLIGAATRPGPSVDPLLPVRIQSFEGRHGLLLRAVRLGRGRELFERLRPVAMLVLIDLDAPMAAAAEALRAVWGLTPREAELAVMIGHGCRLERAAARLGMSEGTARQHLKAIFRRMEIDHQAELAHLVTRIGS